LKHVSPPRVSDKLAPEEFQMLISNLSYSEYVGRLAIGRVMAGTIRKNQRVIRRGIDASGNAKNEKFGIQQLYTFEGLKQKEAAEVSAGDIAVLAGSEFAEIGDTIVGAETGQPLPRIIVEKPTLGMVFSVNTSPLSGKEGEAIQSRKLRERLLKE